MNLKLINLWTLIAKPVISKQCYSSYNSCPYLTATNFLKVYRSYSTTQETASSATPESPNPQKSSPDLILDFSRSNGIVVMQLNRPQVRNALGKNLIDLFNEALNTLAAAPTDEKVDVPQPRALIIASSTPGMFCAGADLKERLNIPVNEVGTLVGTVRQLFHELYTLPIPTIAAIDGAALGGGLEMALACDIRIGASNAKLGLVETKLAIIPGAGGTQRLPKLIGAGKAKELIFSGRTVLGEEAAKIGLINHCVAQNAQGDAAFQYALTLATEIAENGPVAVRSAKLAIDKGLEATNWENSLEIEDTCYMSVIPTEDRVEALNAFKENRKPVFKGK